MSSPVTLTLPWSVLVRDNARYGVLRGRMILTREYRQAKEAAYMLACGQVRDRPAFSAPVALEARIYFPDRQRKRDAGNYRKLVTDALEGVLYPDDTLIHDERWVNAGVDRKNPRVEIRVEAIAVADAA